MVNMSHLTTPSFEECYDKYYPVIYRHIYRKIYVREQAEDLTQETFLKWLRYAGNRFETEAEIRTCLYRIANTITIDAVRYNKSRPVCEVLPDEWHYDQPDSVTQEDFSTEFVQREELREQVARVCQHLSPKEVKFLKLAAMGYSAVEMAQGDVCTPRAIIMRIARARQKAREQAGVA